MGEVILQKYKHMKQPTENSCWITCAAMIINADAKKRCTVETLIHRYELNDKMMDSPFTVLEKQYGRLLTDDKISTDQYAIPTIEEIKDQICTKEKPFICCVGITEPESTVKDSLGRACTIPNYEGGHWILITGVDTEIINGKEKLYLYILDPELDSGDWFEWHPKIYWNKEPKLYWQNTTYFDL